MCAFQGPARGERLVVEGEQSNVVCYGCVTGKMLTGRRELRAINDSSRYTKPQASRATIQGSPACQRSTLGHGN
jgi:hypothetical protein